MIIPELKPCPHCGGAGELKANYSSKLRAYFVFVHCIVCDASGKAIITQYHPDDQVTDACLSAVHAWNMRTNNE